MVLSQYRGPFVFWIAGFRVEFCQFHSMTLSYIIAAVNFENLAIDLVLMFLKKHISLHLYFSFPLFLLKFLKF